MEAIEDEAIASSSCTSRLASMNYYCWGFIIEKLLPPEAYSGCCGYLCMKMLLPPMPAEDSPKIAIPLGLFAIPPEGAAEADELLLLFSPIMEQLSSPPIVPSMV